MISRPDLFAQFHAVRRSLALLLPLLPAPAADWRPADNMRSAWELATHLAQIPAIDTASARGADEAAVHTQRDTLLSNTPDGLLAVWDQGMTDLETYYNSLSDADFAGLETTAFFEYTAVAKTWLLETLLHTHLHRAQLFNYLKQMGHPVDDSYLYV